MMAAPQDLHAPAAGPASGLGPESAQPSAGAWPIRPHGTKTRYRHGPDENDTPGQGCRCVPCGDAAAKAVNLSRLARDRGEPRLVDAQPVREHVSRIHAQGLPLTTIAVLAPVAYVVVSRLMYGAPADGYPPSRRLLAENAKALLAVSMCAVGTEGVTIAVGTMRRLQALAWAGWPAPYVAPRVPLNPDYMRRLMRGHTGSTVTVETARGVAAVFRELWAADPVASGVPAVKAGQVRALSAGRGWVSGLAWDDIDDPDAKPQGVRREATS